MNESEEQVVLVNEKDEALAVSAKLEAHRKGLLHRAFSVLLFNERGQMLLQKRAPGKYHSAGLWANSCCGHPRPQEELGQAAVRRLQEELGIVCDLSHGFTFRYETAVPPDLIENEIDHVFLGHFHGQPALCQAEVSAYRWVSEQELIRELEIAPQLFAPWFPVLFDALLKDPDARRNFLGRGQ